MDFWPFKAAYYRVFQFVFDLGARVLPWRRAQLTEGAGSIRKVPALLQSAGVAHPMVVAGPRLMKSGLVSKLLSLLDTAGIAYSVFGDVEPNPSVATVDKIQARYLSEACDGFIAIGGGSSMDAAKAAAARAANPGKSVAALGGLLKVRHPIDPFFAIPTTAGTGSETTIAAVVVDTDTHHKYAIMDLKLIPRDAILDPELTLGLPPAVTAATGMDALTHAVESYLCRNNNTKESIRCAEDATVMIFQNLERTYRDGQDLEARSAMLKASFLAGYAFTRAGVGNVHAIAHTLGGLYDTPHGLANAVILPVVLEDYGAVVYKKLARLAELTGICRDGTAEHRAKSFISEIRVMNRRMGIPDHLDCILDRDIDTMIAWAGREANPVYPVPVLYDPTRFRRVIERVRGN